MHSAPRIRTAFAGVALLSSLGLTACGNDEPPKAKDVWNKAQDSLGKHKSFEVKGNSKDRKDRDVALTIAGDTAGKAYSIQVQSKAAAATLINAGGKMYVKGNDEYYKVSLNSTAASVASLVANKWMISGESSGASPIKDVSDELRNDSKPFSKQMLSDKATVTTDKLDGKDVWKITGADKKTIAWVTKDDKYDLLKAQGINRDANNSSHIIAAPTFSDYDKVDEIKAPAGAKTPAELIGKR